jgi:DNA-binding NtrC family response regulator
MSAKLILLIEDDQNLRQSFVLILQRAGYLVTATECVSKAMSMIKSSKYQLIISDMNMTTTQNSLIPIILSMYPNLSLVILTDQSINEVGKGGVFNGAHYLSKPIAPERLLDFVQTIFTLET